MVPQCQTLQFRKTTVVVIKLSEFSPLYCPSCSASSHNINNRCCFMLRELLRGKNYSLYLQLNVKGKVGAEGSEKYHCFNSGVGALRYGKYYSGEICSSSLETECNTYPAHLPCNLPGALNLSAIPWAEVFVFVFFPKGIQSMYRTDFQKHFYQLDTA